jgi:hypothetical protein
VTVDRGSFYSGAAGWGTGGGERHAVAESEGGRRVGVLTRPVGDGRPAMAWPQCMRAGSTRARYQRRTVEGRGR